MENFNGELESISRKEENSRTEKYNIRWVKGRFDTPEENRSGRWKKNIQTKEKNVRFRKDYKR